MYVSISFFFYLFIFFVAKNTEILFMFFSLFSCVLINLSCLVFIFVFYINGGTK